ncbi:hypothetical protein GALL_514420 [mine drainage metagenome]|uniref:Uncharacterized protein n=1 Tax=mine drainage metagenome TaxID=410659 RepID=A0A1J5PTV0_9ZZZZ
MNRKFQPTPSRIKPERKCRNSLPVSAMATCPPSRAMPAAMIGSTPKRRIRLPVKKEGANMPRTCHWITVAEAPSGWPQICIASGVAVITMIITA